MQNSTTEAKKRKTQSTETAYIYILSHISNTIVKVGETAVCPASREKDYIRKYELKGFSLQRTFEVAPRERKNIEKHAHQILKRFQVSGIDRAREISVRLLPGFSKARFSASLKLIGSIPCFASLRYSDANSRASLRETSLALPKPISRRFPPREILKTH